MNESEFAIPIQTCPSTHASYLFAINEEVLKSEYNESSFTKHPRTNFTFVYFPFTSSSKTVQQTFDRSFRDAAQEAKR